MLDITCLAATKMLVHLIIVILVTIAPMDVAGNLHGVGRFLERSKPVIRGIATDGQNHESSKSPEERISYVHEVNI